MSKYDKAVRTTGFKTTDDELRSLKGMAKVDAIPDKECIRLDEAARYLQCSPGTLSNWIYPGKFTDADGLRKIGGLSRVHLPTLRARFEDGTLLSGKADGTLPSK
jgi:hypothetical protein